MRDLTPKEVELRNFVKSTIFFVYKKFGFSEIETPSTEDISLLTGGNGGDNEKMLYKILKRGEKLDIANATNESDLADLGLRYDLTVPLCRFYANNRAKLPSPFKVIQIGSVWRAEKPQKGRFRQFTQCDIDIIGNKKATAEVELILATSAALVEIGFKNFRVRINDRRVLEGLANYAGFEKTTHDRVFIILDKLDKIGIDGVENELKESGFPEDAIKSFISVIEKSTAEKLTIGRLTSLLPDLDSEVLANLAFVMDTVSAQANTNYAIDLDISLVRGMGYYTGQIFEVEAQDYKSSIAGGGRYDNLIGKFLKESIPACGFSIGFERVISILEAQNFEVPAKGDKIALLYDVNISAFNNLLTKANELRAQGNIVSIETKSKNFTKQLDNLVEQGFNFFGVYDESRPLEIKPLSKKA